MQKGKMMYEGKAKKIYETKEEDKVVIEYKDDATAFDGKKKGQIKNKGQFNAEISTMMFKLLENKGIPTHLIEQLSEREVLAKKLSIIPVEVVMRNIVAGSLAKRLGVKEGTPLTMPVLEFYYKDDELGDPMINEYHIYSQKMAEKEDMEKIKDMTFKINDILLSFFSELGINLVDYKLEFGKSINGDVYLGDEITPDTCRLWDSETGKKLDKDRFRRDLGDVEDAYQEILNRIKES